MVTKYNPIPIDGAMADLVEQSLNQKPAYEIVVELSEIEADEARRLLRRMRGNRGK